MMKNGFFYLVIALLVAALFKIARVVYSVGEHVTATKNFPNLR